jgi:hypothetical protein
MSKFEYRIRAEDGKLMLRRKGSKRIMVMDGYEKRCCLNLIMRNRDVPGLEAALENIWVALVNRANAEYAMRREYRNA